MLDCLPPAWLQVGQYELEPLLAVLPPQVGQYAELLDWALALPRAALTPLLYVVFVPRELWVCWAEDNVVP